MNDIVLFVLLDRRVTGLDVDVVHCGSEQGTHDIVQRLLGLGR